MYGMRQVGIFGLPDWEDDGSLARPAIWEEGGGIITVAEYARWKQPEIMAILEGWRRVERHSLRWWARVMMERPKSGLGGLLRGEKAV